MKTIVETKRYRLEIGDRSFVLEFFLDGKLFAVYEPVTACLANPVGLLLEDHDWHEIEGGHVTVRTKDE